MLTKLTETQTKQMAEYARKWTEIGLCTKPADRPRAEAGLRAAYMAAGLQPPERIVWCGSPLSAALTLFAVESVRESVRESVGDGVWASVGDGVWAEVNRSVWESVWESVRLGVQGRVWSSVGASVWYRVRESVGADVWAEVEDIVWPIYGQHDAAPLSFYEYFHDVYGLLVQTERLAGLWEIAKSAGWVWPFENVAFICERHNVVRKNSAGQLHCEGGAAVEYPDGWKVHALNGVLVPGWLAETPVREIDARQILQIENVDQRREGIRRVGLTRIVEQLKPQVLDSLFDYELLAVEMNHGLPWRFLKMVNPSIGCIHIEAVPRECETVQHALNWRRSQNIDYGWFPAQLT